jgi:hypothetical protein
MLFYGLHDGKGVMLALNAKHQQDKWLVGQIRPNN